ncbi:MAG: tagaturonate reductase, partial [Clostridia bacterium]|nr:tagaturonate reductase [Clostridia bacterium]
YCILKYASLWGYGQDFYDFIENENIFCNTLVDRINTGFNKEDSEKYKDNMVNTSEYFHLWVIEGYKDLFSEIPFDRCGLNVILTDNLEKYRTRKVRILNGAHTAITPYGLLKGFETVKSAVDDEKMNEFLKGCIFDEIIPTLDLPEEELVNYAQDVLIRFSNPHIKHLLSSISLNSVSKYKVRVLPSVKEYIKRFDKIPQKLVFALAKLIEFYKKGTPTDDSKVIDFIKNSTVSEILKNTALWGEDLTFLESEIEKYVD